MTEAAAPIPAGAGGSLPLSRREFLYYLWGVSMAVAIAGATGATIWFALPRFKEGEFGGVVTVPGGEGRGLGTFDARGGDVTSVVPGTPPPPDRDGRYSREEQPLWEGDRSQCDPAPCAHACRCDE